ncbi:signal peptidase II [Maricaulis sp.]|uniref:signal peptidase II n=1 Tax=Maricaulis sp. TaxID=1486257 RepID=UPI0026358965|nr:signal peptidase II [Maricaulis sp.]
MADTLKRVVDQLTRPGAARLGLVLAAVIFVFDQLTKYLVLDRLNFSPPGCLEFQLASPAERMGMANNCGHIELSPVFDLTMVWNKGVSFGLLGADNLIGRIGLIIFSLAVSGLLLAGLFGYGPMKVIRPLQAVSFGCIIGGALGNVIDRAVYGAVVDFFNFSDVYFPWVFNIADVSINVGVGILILDMVLGERDGAKSKP